MSGRKRVPVDIILAKGDSHLTKEEVEKRREQEEAFKPDSDKISCPSWVKDKVAKKEYKRISEELVKHKLLTNLDVTTLASYCIAYANYVKVIEELEGQDLIIEQTNKAGFTNRVPNPLIQLQIKYSDEMKKLSSELGLTFNARMKMVVPEPPKKKKSKFEDLDG